MTVPKRRLDSIPVDSFIDWLVAAFTASNVSGGDASGRAAVGLPLQQVDVKLTDDLNPGQMAAFTVGTGTVAHVSGESHALLSVSASGDRALLRTRAPQVSRVGESIAIIPTLVVETPDNANVAHRCGYPSEDDGLFLLVSNDVASFVIRDSIAPVETPIAQSAWNQDKFDGTGDSGVTLDLSKSLELAIDLQSLETGRVRFGFRINGQIVWAHYADHSNSTVAPFMASANLHMAWGIEATGVPGATVNMRALGGTIIRSGAAEVPVNTQTAERLVTAPATAPASQDWVSVVSVRVKDAYKERASVLPGLVGILSDGVESLAWRVMRLPFDDVPAGITTWADVGPESVCEQSRDVAVIDITKGNTYASGQGTGGDAAASRVAGAFDLAGLGLTDDSGTAGVQPNQDVMVLAVAKLSAIGTASVHGTLQITEVR